EDVMKVGIALNMLQKEGRSDADVFAEHLALGDRAEQLGFDSLFALEHHFTGYAMSPSPTQLLSYFAGRTRRLTLGTAVIVLPWHDPVRVAEEIALLDVLSGGRCLFGFGRGAASVEYAGMRVPMEEARARFVESARIVVMAVTQESFEWKGEFFTIPRTAIRPRPISHPERRFYASSVSPESAEIMAKLGFGVLVVMQNEWAKAAEDIQRYRDIAASVGHTPRPPIILTNISVAESRSEADAAARPRVCRSRAAGERRRAAAGDRGRRCVRARVATSRLEVARVPRHQDRALVALHDDARADGRDHPVLQALERVGGVAGTVEEHEVLLGGIAQRDLAALLRLDRLARRQPLEVGHLEVVAAGLLAGRGRRGEEARVEAQRLLLGRDRVGEGHEPGGGERQALGTDQWP